jgi:ribose transport system substrate-binding protein
MKTHLLSSIVLAVTVCLLSVSCSPSTDSSKKYLVVFSQCNNAEPYRAAQNAEMEKLWGEQPDVRLVIMDGQQDSVKQSSQIDTAINMKPNLLIVAPNERAPLTEVMGRAMAAHIPVICLERDIVQPNYTTWIRVDNKAIGGMVGQFVLDYLTKKYGSPKGKIVEIAGLKGVEAETNRKAGAHEIWDKYPGITFVPEVEAKWLQSEAKDRMTEILAVNQNIDVVYGRSDAMSMGAYLAAKEKGREKEMIFVSIDGLPGDAGGVHEVEEGILAATCTYPMCVDKAVEIGTKLLHDPTFVPDKTYTMPSKLVTPENAASIYK